ncbi:MAG TPA: S46 family peptidase, partial [Candidatus Aminicenantes bacterium]|nr:S46 family peptidase [Candidatus Aminicenantes bacterium]
MKRTAIATSLLFLLLSFRPLPAEEGMFLPHQLPPEVLARMKAMGCTLSEKDIFSASGSLAQAVVSLGGGTGSFVSPQGLILTNHHVAFGAAQRQSSLKANLIRDGYLAPTREDEIPAPGYKAWVLKEIKEVTADVLKGVTAKTPPAKRTEKVERNIKALVEKYEGHGKDYSVRIASFHGGLSYYMFKSLLLRDLRIVYIPSRNIGEFGGETDNWIWPRHTGDFSFLRAYVGRDGHPADFARENVPYVPEKFLPISARDIDEGDFALLMGFPGRTSRYLTTEEIRFLVERDYPERIRLTKAFIDILEEEAQKDPEAAIKVAGTLKGLYNGYKNSQGKLEGFLRAGIVARRDAEQRALLSTLEQDPASAKK